MKAKYGEKLRKHLANHHTPLTLLEMGKDIFDAVVDTNILLLREGGPGNPFPAVDQDIHSQTEDFPPPRQTTGDKSCPKAKHRGDHPVTGRRTGILDKMRTKGTPLGQWNIRINYGIKTGCNDAFVIDKTTRDALIENGPIFSHEIIKPILRGRKDI